MSSKNNNFILTFSCPDRIGIVAAVSGFLTEQDCNILESAQFSDQQTNHFFMRTVFANGNTSPSYENLKAAFKAIGKRFEMTWEIHDAGKPPKVLLMVSRFGHCLNDLLFRNSIGALPMEVSGVVSNHPDLESLATMHNIPYYYLPVTKETKPEQEKKLISLIEETGTELVILARYMQVLSSDLCRYLDSMAINIHHSFLPSFKGARPYHQAHVRGVKLIGATAHYVTSDLDEGPIIEQETARVSHAKTPEQLVAIGRNIENQVLAQAVAAHCERRVLMNGTKTIVFQ